MFKNTHLAAHELPRVEGDKMTLLREQLVNKREYAPTTGERLRLDWLTRAADMPGKSTIRVALLLLRLAMECGRKRHLLVTPQRLANESISRVGGYEGLVALEKAGLVEVTRCHGRSPLVSIVELGVRQETGG